MKTKTIKVCNAVMYDISCELNDPTDIKCGGSPVLGYEFYVSSDEKKEEIRKFLKNCINKYHRPFIGISTRKQKDFPIKNLWTREMMEDCIKNNSI